MASKCTKCKKSIGGFGDNVHWETHKGKKYCETCLPSKKNAKDTKKLSLEIKTSTYYSCDKCGKRFKTLKNAEKHEENCEGSEEQDKEDYKEKELEEKTTRYQIRCNQCGYVWDTKYARIPAKCPACARSIHNNASNYTVLTRYIRSNACCGAVMIIILTLLTLLLLV